MVAWRLSINENDAFEWDAGGTRSLNHMNSSREHLLEELWWPWSYLWFQLECSAKGRLYFKTRIVHLWYWVLWFFENWSRVYQIVRCMTPVERNHPWRFKIRHSSDCFTGVLGLPPKPSRAPKYLRDLNVVQLLGAEALLSWRAF